MQLHGFHHLTAITADAPANYRFYTQVLGLRLVKKSVNQDDTSAYHLFYADGLASPGSDVTFFDWPMTRERRGTRSIVRTGLRIDSTETLNFWADRLTAAGLKHPGISQRDKRTVLDFEDPEGQRLTLAVDAGPADRHPWEKSPVPAEHQIRGLGPITLSVPELKPTANLLTGVMEMRHARQYTAPATVGTGASDVHVFEMGTGGAAAELHVAVEPGLIAAGQGAGGVHHVAFRVPTFAEYDQWNTRLQQFRVPSSGPVDRYYFRSLYFREPNGVLFELATDEPGFAADEPMDHLGARLALPPFLEPRRAQIEAGLKPLATSE